MSDIDLEAEVNQVKTPEQWMKDQHLREFRTELQRLQNADIVSDYEARATAVYKAMGRAAAAGIPVGIRNDPQEPEWPVVYFELPTGQISYHMPEHPVEYDLHDTPEKRARIARFLLDDECERAF